MRRHAIVAYPATVCIYPCGFVIYDVLCDEIRNLLLLLSSELNSMLLKLLGEKTSKSKYGRNSSPVSISVGKLFFHDSVENSLGNIYRGDIDPVQEGSECLLCLILE